MLEALQKQIRDDCRTSVAAVEGLAKRLAGQRIAVVGGTGFSGTWIAETVAMLNDEQQAGIRLDLFGLSATKWPDRHPHLKRNDTVLHAQDVRSSFELPRDVNLVIYAAGIADPRVSASEPQRVFETTVYGLNNTLSAAHRLEDLRRFVNISSGLVAGAQASATGIRETDCGQIDFTRFHNLYAESRRAAESLACAFAGQFRVPLSTARAFTFLGPYQGLDTPWAVNNFIRDTLSGHEIRLNGDGVPRRSYLYGSDVAAWLLQIATSGSDGVAYNLGGAEPVSHAEAAKAVAALSNPAPHIALNSTGRQDARSHDFFADTAFTQEQLGVTVTVDFLGAVQRTLAWHAQRVGLVRLVK